MRWGSCCQSGGAAGSVPGREPGLQSCSPRPRSPGPHIPAPPPIPGRSHGGGGASPERRQRPPAAARRRVRDKGRLSPDPRAGPSGPGPGPERPGSYIPGGGTVRPGSYIPGRDRAPRILRPREGPCAPDPAPQGGTVRPGSCAPGWDRAPRILLPREGPCAPDPAPQGGTVRPGSCAPGGTVRPGSCAQGGTVRPGSCSPGRDRAPRILRPGGDRAPRILRPREGPCAPDPAPQGGPCAPDPAPRGGPCAREGDRRSVPGRRGGAPHPGAPGRLPPTLPLRLPSAPAWHGAGLGAGPRGGGARLGRLRLHRRGGPPLPAPPGGHPRPPVPLVPPQAPCPAPRGRQRGSHQLPPTAQLTGGPALAKPPRWAKGGAPEAARPPPAVPPKTPAKPLRGTQGTGLGSWQPERGDSCPPSAAPCQAPPVPAKPCPPPRLPSPPTNPQSLPKRAPQPRPLPSLPRPPSPCQTCSLPPPPTQPPPPPAKLCPPPPAPPQKEHAPAPGDEPRQGDSDGHSPEPEPPRDRCCPSPKGPGWGLPLQDEPLYQTYRQAVIRKEIQRQTLPHSASPSSWDEAPAPPPGPPGAPRSTLWQDLPAVRESGLLWHISPQERKMQESLFEVLTSEASYQRSLRLLAQHFVGSRELGETLGPRERQALFSSVLRVKEISARFLAALQGRVAESLQIRDVSDVVAAHARRDFPAYVDYVRNQPYQEKEYSALMERNGPFGAALGRLQEHPLCQGLPLLSFLLLPFQRITRLKMLLEVGTPGVRL
ncbi:uncharacterized protein [Lepidochelys kempii]|uniref:uncharacterized protein n=1 Tax=Lepidochelys kempii TaxID=8472 RepID=UPI003C6EE58C